MGYQSEAELENKLIEKLKTQGYERVLINDYSELENNFREQLNKFNKKALDEKPLTDKEFERVLNILNGKSVLQSAIKLRKKIDFDREDGTKIYLKLLSENAEDNIYQVSNQITVQGKYKNRYDVTILINGLPLVQIELKRSGIDINEATDYFSTFITEVNELGNEVKQSNNAMKNASALMFDTVDGSHLTISAICLLFNLFSFSKSLILFARISFSLNSFLIG